MVNNKRSPIIDNEIENFLYTKDINLTATTDNYKVYKGAEYVIISTPTNYVAEKNYYNTRYVGAIIAKVLSVNPDAIMVIKSTVPESYTKSVREKFETENIIS